MANISNAPARDARSLAQVAYEAYREFKQRHGQDMPLWADAPDRDAWAEVAAEVSTHRLTHYMGERDE